MAVLLWQFFHPVGEKKRKGHGSVILSGLKNIGGAFYQKSTRLLMITLICFLFGYLGFLNYLAVYAIKIYHFDKLTNTVFLAVFGVWFAIAMVVIVPYLSRKHRVESVCLIAMLMQVIPVFMMLVWHKPLVGWISVVFIAIGVSAAYILLITLLSNCTDALQTRKDYGGDGFNGINWFGLLPQSFPAYCKR